MDQTFYAPDSPEVIAFVEQKCGTAPEIKGFTHVESMVKTVEECKKNCIGVHFRFANGTGQHEKRNSIEYTIYTNRLKLPTKQRYVTDSLDASFSRK